MFKNCVKKSLNLLGYEKATIVQELAWNPIIEGRDVLIIAPTGFGKTLAAVMPLFERINKDKKIQMLYITPLRALNRDIFERIIKLGSKLGIEIDIRHGDTPQKVRNLQRRDPPNVLVTTPETMQSLLVGKKFREHLKNVDFVVIDEIHEICESKRGSQLAVALERLKEIAGDFQRVGLSATIGDPKLVSKFMSEKKVQIVDVRKKKRYEIKVLKPMNDPIGKIVELVNKSQSTLIFTNTREAAEALGAKLKEFIDVEVHHSSLSKDVRIKVESKFKSGEVKAIVATSSLELGIDVGSVDLVIQYGSPRQVIRLIQRVGRSGHRSHLVSKGIIIPQNWDDYAEAKAIVKLFKEGWMEEPIIPEKPLDVLAHQIVGICIENGEIELKKIYEIIKRAFPFRNLKYAEFIEVVNFLKELKLIGGEEKIYRTRRGLLYYFENLSMIPDEKNYIVIDEAENKKIGILHEGFVSEYVYEGAEFIMKGETWKVVDLDGRKIKVVRSSGVEVSIPSWEGELIPVDKKVANRACKIKKEIEYFKEQKEVGFPDCKKIIVEDTGGIIIIHSCFGNKINQAIAKTIGSLMSSKIGKIINFKIDPYRIIIKNSEGWNYESIIKLIIETEPEWIKDILLHSIKNSQIFEFRFLHVARRFGAIRKEVEFTHGMLSRMIKFYSDTPIIKETINEIFREKVDVIGARAVFEKIKEKKIKVVGGFSYKISPLGQIGLAYSLSSLVKPKEEDEIIEMVKSRLLNKKYYFVCMKCGNQIGILSISSAEFLKCNKCGAKLIGFVPEKEKEIAKRASKKYFSNKPLDKEERKMIKKLKETAELFLNYGKNALIAMGGYGIGTTTARRILSKHHRGIRELVKEIIKAERQFIMTRKYW